MGSRGFSSKTKSSRRKSSKVSSEARRRKKNGRTKSKRLRHRDDSASSYSDNHSSSSVSISSSSSDDGYRRGRSRMRSDVKVGKKRARRSHSSRDSSEYSHRVKKRKVARRKGESDVRRKTQKKKPRRDASISSVSSDSRSCSTCRGGNSNSRGESEFESPRGRSREKKKNKRDSGKSKSGTKNNKNRSPSCFLCSGCSDCSGHSIEDKLAAGNNSRRLRSVVTVSKQPLEEEEKERDKSGHKEEIIYDHDDYPSCKSNDSNDGGSKKDLVYHALDASQKGRLENMREEEASIPNTRPTELIEGGKDVGGLYSGSISCSDGVGANPSSKENEGKVSSSFASSVGDDLETALRQKALENLRKFREGLQTDAKIHPQKNRINSDVTQPSNAKVASVHIKSAKEDGSRVVGATQVVAPSTRPSPRVDSPHPTMVDQKVSLGESSGIKPENAKGTVVCPLDQWIISGIPEEKDLSCGGAALTDKYKPGRSALEPETSGSCFTMKQVPMAQSSPKSKLVVVEGGVNKCAAETSQTGGQPNNTQGIEASNASESAAPEHSSCLKPTLEVHSSKERQDEVKVASQFEQKTMSVMRGGEMVQVSYKVYIPKKTPALARRQLRR